MWRVKFNNAAIPAAAYLLKLCEDPLSTVEPRYIEVQGTADITEYLDSYFIRG
jgi:hypothetical protein